MPKGKLNTAVFEQKNEDPKPAAAAPIGTTNILRKPKQASDVFGA